MISDEAEELLTIHVNIQITAASLHAIVAHSKQLAHRTENGMIRVDTAELVAALVSKFLNDNNFDSYVLDDRHYTGLL